MTCLRGTVRVLGLIAALGLASPATAEDQPPAPAADQPHMSAERIVQHSEGEIEMIGDVDLRYGEIRILADRIHYDDAKREARAEGNVVLIYANSQISGDRLLVNLDTRYATVWNAHGYIEPDIIFDADRLERVSEDTLVITNGSVTTCTQPTPYWSFHVSTARLQKDRYAHMTNVALKVGHAPVLYTPYLLWPLKEDRASGLLLPNVGYSRRRGSFIGNALYFVLGRSQDLTTYFDLYGKTGTGYGFEYRFVPTARGQGSLTGYFLDDTVDDPTTPDEDETRTRYRFNLRHTQRFDGGYRLLADLNKVSDLDYYLDFERDISQTTSPTVYSQVDLVRNWSSFAMNTRIDRQEQFITADEELLLQRLPELELRARGIRIGNSPAYLSFLSSAGLYNKRQTRGEDPNFGFVDLETTWERYDLFPTLSASFSPTAWLDLSPSLSARGTYYTERLVDPNSTLLLSDSQDIFRGFASFNLAMVGPRFFRIYGDDPAATRYKHTIEPGISYSYIPDTSGDDENIIRFDEIDTLAGDLHRITYSLTSRLFAKRPPREPERNTPQPEEAAPDAAGPTEMTVPLIDPKDLPEEIQRALEDRKRSDPIGAFEMASFSINTIYSFDPDKPFLATRVHPDGTSEALESPAGPVTASFRFNPTAAASLDLGAVYNTFFNGLDSINVSTNLRSLEHGYLRLSWFYDRDLQGRFVNADDVTLAPGDPNGSLKYFDASQVRLIGGTSMLARKITLDLEGSYDIENQALQTQRYRLGYHTQCCGILVEMARRDFETIDEIEYRFTLNLRGVGTFLDLQGRP